MLISGEVRCGHIKFQTEPEFDKLIIQFKYVERFAKRCSHNELDAISSLLLSSSSSSYQHYPPKNEIHNKASASISGLIFSFFINLRYAIRRFTNLFCLKHSSSSSLVRAWIYAISHTIPTKKFLCVDSYSISFSLCIFNVMKKLLVIKYSGWFHLMNKPQSIW